MPPLLASLEAWQQAIRRPDKPAVIEYQSPTCQHCAFLRPTFESLAEKYADLLDFYEVDVDATADIAGAAGVLAQPTTAVYSRGQQVAVLKGAVRDHLIGMIEATIEGLREANANASTVSTG